MPSSTNSRASRPPTLDLTSTLRSGSMVPVSTTLISTSPRCTVSLRSVLGLALSKARTPINVPRPMSSNSSPQPISHFFIMVLSHFRRYGFILVHRSAGANKFRILPRSRTVLPKRVNLRPISPGAAPDDGQTQQDGRSGRGSVSLCQQTGNVQAYLPVARDGARQRLAGKDTAPGQRQQFHTARPVLRPPGVARVVEQQPVPLAWALLPGEFGVGVLEGVAAVGRDVADRHQRHRRRCRAGSRRAHAGPQPCRSHPRIFAAPPRIDSRIAARARVALYR